MLEPTGAPTEVIPARGTGVRRAASYLTAGELVAFPTETVYGLGADATNAVAVREVFTAKGRPLTDPLIVHVSDLGMAEDLGDMSVGGGVARRLVDAFWPGPLTVVVPKLLLGSGSAAPYLAPEVSMGSTVGLRCPANQVALDLIHLAGVPVAAPSANRFGRVSPTTAQHVLDELDGRIRAVLDGGPTTLGVESTVVAFDGTVVRLLRPGGVPVEDLRALLPEGSLHVSMGTIVASGEVSESPGTSISHYVPSVPLVLTDGIPGLADALAVALRAEGLSVDLIRLPGAEESARNLYSLLRDLDADRGDGCRVDVAVVAALDPAGLGRAVNDRLFRAAHGHIERNASRSTVERILGRLQG
jgi:L-threonylcarbamoyladenylate synthase